MSLAQIRDNPTIVQNYVTVAGVEIPSAITNTARRPATAN
jgi:hypothetical protein